MIWHIVMNLRVILPFDFFNIGFLPPDQSSAISSRISMSFSSGNTFVMSPSRLRSPLSMHWRTATVVMSLIHEAIQHNVSAVNFWGSVTSTSSFPAVAGPGGNGMYEP